MPSYVNNRPGPCLKRMLVLVGLGLGGCATPSLPPSPIAATPAGMEISGVGVIVAIRALPRDGAAAADLRRVAALSLDEADARYSGTAREFIVVIEGRGAVSVVQGDADRLVLGARVRLLPGPRARIAPSAA